MDKFLVHQLFKTETFKNTRIIRPTFQVVFDQRLRMLKFGIRQGKKLNKTKKMYTLILKNFNDSIKHLIFFKSSDQAIKNLPIRPFI